jgi:membrane protein insertase Oxa1/YidC/SpoIIIJ
MGVFLYNYAAGLSLYMITQSGLGIIETKIIKKLWPVDEKELATKKNGFWARMAAMQEEAQRRRRNLEGGR